MNPRSTSDTSRIGLQQITLSIVHELLLLLVVCNGSTISPQLTVNSIVKASRSDLTSDEKLL
jgi:hypothetical protein